MHTFLSVCTAKHILFPNLLLFNTFLFLPKSPVSLCPLWQEEVYPYCRRKRERKGRCYTAWSLIESRHGGFLKQATTYIIPSLCFLPLLLLPPPFLLSFQNRHWMGGFLFPGISTSIRVGILLGWFCEFLQRKDWL
jgi:hypothetical protein